LLIKIDVNGSEQMNKTFGGAGRDMANSAMQTLDGGYILVGETESYGEGVDGWLIRLMQMATNNGIRLSEEKILIGFFRLSKLRMVDLF